MPQQFLCANHRQWLSADMNMAKWYYLKWVAIANNYVERGRYREALPFWGCSYELAGLLLNASVGGLSQSIHRYAEAVQGLINTYYALADDGTAESLRVTASSRLAQQLPNSELYDQIALSIQALYMPASESEGIEPSKMHARRLQ